MAHWLNTVDESTFLFEHARAYALHQGVDNEQALRYAKWFVNKFLNNKPWPSHVEQFKVWCELD